MTGILSKGRNGVFRRSRNDGAGIETAEKGWRVLCLEKPPFALWGVAVFFTSCGTSLSPRTTKGVGSKVFWVVIVVDSLTLR